MKSSAPLAGPHCMAWLSSLILLTQCNPVADAQDVGSRIDLWDISQGAVVTATSGIRIGFDAADIFGGTNSGMEPGQCVFSDDQPAGFVHFVEWQTATAVGIGKINVHAGGDGEIYMHQREFDRLVVRARSRGSADYDLLLLDYTPAHPYSFAQPDEALLVSTLIPPVSAREFRAEFTQFTGSMGFDGPRVIELDAWPPSCMPSPPGLVGWWRAEGDGTDALGNHDGILVNDLGFDEGLVGEALGFNAGAQHLFIPAADELAISSLTIEAWIKPSTLQEQPLVEYSPTTGRAGVHLWISVDPAGHQTLPGSLFANVLSEDGESHLISTGGDVIMAGVWSHVALTYDQQTGVARLFHNGEEVATGDLGIFVPRTAYPIFVGHRPLGNTDDPNGRTFSGLMDEISIYNRALPPAEVQAIFAAGGDGKCVPPNCTPAPGDLVAWWQGEGDGTDAIGINEGELVNSLGFADGLVGQSFEFTQNGQHLVVPSLVYYAPRSFTLETWIHPDIARFGEQQPIFEFAEDSGFAGVHFWLSVAEGGGFESPGTLFANIRSDSGENHTLTSASRVVGGEWSHVALTYDYSSGAARIYLNGTLEGMAEFRAIAPETGLPLRLGYRPHGSFDGGAGYTFVGKLDEPSLYNRALSDAEIAAIHDAGADGKCRPLPPLCAPAPDGMLAWWRGEGESNDETGRHHGQTTTVAYTNGLVGTAMLFDGETSRVRVPFDMSLLSSGFSVETWLKPLGPVIDEWDQDVVFGQALGSPSLLVEPGEEGVRPVFAFTMDPFLAPAVISDVELPIHEFSHVAGTWDGTMLRIYVNGVLAGEVMPGYSLYFSTCDFFIGGLSGNCASYSFDGGYFHGVIDELSLYGRALSEAEISRIYNAGSNGKCLPPGYLLAINATAGGSVLREPDAAEYRPGQTVTLTALAEPGFAFVHWEGDATGTEPEVELSMDTHKLVRALFADVAAPEIEMGTPSPGVTENQFFALTGTIRDNVAVAAASWEWNGQALGPLPLADGQFLVEGLQLVWGSNHIRVVANDSSGNEAVAEVVVEWIPARVLSVENPDPIQEGQSLTFPIQLSSSGDVGGASFVLRYDPDYLKQPVLEWLPAIDSALNQVNIDAPGEMRATFALPAVPVPPGTQTLAMVTFRSRSVPADLTSELELDLLDISQPTGDSIPSGSAARSGSAMILLRRVVGDNNANDRWDAGDATIMQRLLAGLEPARPWDETGNDVNQNSSLDSGDVVRVLRAVVGLDPQPTPSSQGPHGATNLFGRLQPMNTHLAGSLRLDADRLSASPGQLVTLRVHLTDLPSPISAVSLRLDYPTNALRLLNALSHRPGVLVPSAAIAIWNVAPAQYDYAIQSGMVTVAFSSALPWPISEGALAEFVFEVQAAQSDRYQWAIRVSEAELTADGYDMMALPEATFHFVGRDPLTPQLITGPAGDAGNGFTFSFLGETGLNYAVEVSSDLVVWTPLISQEGHDEVITVRDETAAGSLQRYYRVRYE